MNYQKIFLAKSQRLVVTLLGRSSRGNCPHQSEATALMTWSTIQDIVLGCGLPCHSSSTPCLACLLDGSVSKDGVATELIPMDEWVQELCIAQEEARKLISANIKSEQQDRVESTPHWSRMWEAGDQVMLRADRRGKGRSKKLSKKWTGPYTIIEVRSPQVVVLEEPNSRNLLTINVQRIKPFNAATPTARNSSSDNGHYEVEEVL